MSQNKSSASIEAMNDLQLLLLMNEAYDELEDEDAEEKKAAEGKKKRIWSQEWLLARNDSSKFSLLYLEVESRDLEKFSNAFRMSPEAFSLLLDKVAPLIEKQQTHLRDPIPAKIRLLATLRYLSSGANFAILEEVFRIDRTTFSKMIPEVCHAIWNKLAPEHIKCTGLWRG